MIWVARLLQRAEEIASFEPAGAVASASVVASNAAHGLRQSVGLEPSPPFAQLLGLLVSSSGTSQLAMLNPLLGEGAIESLVRVVIATALVANRIGHAARCRYGRGGRQASTGRERALFEGLWPDLRRCSRTMTHATAPFRAAARSHAVARRAEALTPARPGRRCLAGRLPVQPCSSRPPRSRMRWRHGATILSPSRENQTPGAAIRDCSCLRLCTRCSFAALRWQFSASSPPRSQAARVRSVTR